MTTTTKVFLNIQVYQDPRLPGYGATYTIEGLTEQCRTGSGHFGMTLAEVAESIANTLSQYSQEMPTTPIQGIGFNTKHSFFQKAVKHEDVNIIKALLQKKGIEILV